MNNNPLQNNEITPPLINTTPSVKLDYFSNSNFAFLLFSLITAMVWVIYITYYNSRVIGYIITRLLTKFYVRKGYLNVGSCTVCALSGKIMFRDIVYITTDYTIRVQDGWLIFRWWRSYVPKDVSEDLSHSDTRLSVMLNGLELHAYNRCELYCKLERTFGLDPSLIPWEELTENGDIEAQINDSENHQQVSIGKSWRDLVPVIKVEVSSSRFVFGNRLVPTTLSINIEEAHCVYSTKPAASKFDHFMHFVKCKAENFKIILAPSPKYTGIADEPPRYMGAGFVVFSSNKIELYYYMDEPGVVPEEPEMLQLANGDIVESTPPIWGIDIKCGKGTDFSYGPWADRQREHLFNFFFPQDYQDLEVTKPLQPGECRQVQSFDIRLSTLYESTIDVLFTKNKETNAVHVNVGPGSYLEVTMPWIVSKDGYVTKITGQLLHLEATTSLQFRSLVESETLEFSVRSHYPIRWNEHQEWLLNLTGCKATGWFIYAHKDFFEDLINDWANKSKPDLLHFIPYTWKLTVLLKEFELLTQSNEYNWVDCSSQNQENSHIAVCGDLFDFSFDLPFDDFLPQSLPLRFWIQGESVDLAIYLPEVHTSRGILLSLDKNAKLLSRDGSVLHPRAQDNSRKWRNICKRSNGWIDFWSIPIAALSIHYTYHPMYPFGPLPQADITTPEKEEILLSPMRMPGVRKNPSVLHWSKDGNQKFDPSTLTPDKVNLELEIGPSVMFLYGTCLRHLLHLKENIFGEDQKFTDMNNPPNRSSNSSSSISTAVAGNNSVEDDLSKKDFDPRFYRPLDVIVSITMHDIQAHLMKSCMEKDPPCPIILLERFGFEMKIEYKEMQLQLLLSPAILISNDKLTNRPHKDNHLNQGHMMLSGLQIRGHGMFSDRDRTLDQHTLEYAWMLEIQIGKLSGKLTSPQLYHVVVGLETLVFLMCDNENKCRPPRLPQECLHGISPKQCPESDADGTYRCPSSNDVKYRMTRCTIDAIDFFLLESGTAMNLWASPIRIATCNLHGNHIKSGITILIPTIRLRQIIAANPQVCNQHGTGTASNSNTNTTCSGRSQHRITGSDETDIWLEVGSVSLGPLILEAAVSLRDTDKNLHLVQHKFLKFHDERYKKLWFLWPSDSKLLVTGRCGCIGGCVFFGRNKNGQRFFKPLRQDIQDGINIAAFRINDPGKDLGFGQSILHESQLVFHTPPYNALDVTIHDQPPPVWTEPKLSSSTSIRSKIIGSDNPILCENVPGVCSVTDSPSTTTTGSSQTSSHNLQFDGKMSLPRRYSYTSATNRLQNTTHSTREVPYARLMDSSPTSTFPPTKLDSDSRLNTLGSILSVPENNEPDGMPKSSTSDSKISVDYFNSNALRSFSSDSKNTEPIIGGSESITSLSVTENKPSSSKDEALFKRTISLSSENQSDTFFSAEEELSQNRNSTDDNALELKSSGSLSSSLRNSVIISSGSYGHEKALSRKRFGSDLNIVPENNKTLISNRLNEIKLTVTAYRSDHEIHTPEHRNNYFGKNYLDQATVAEDEKSLIGSLEHLPRQLIETPASWSSRTDTPKLKSCSLDDDDTLVPTSASVLLLDSSDSHSVSSTSFISAVSSQEDLTLVNLHMQVNKPIVDSPLLMSTYINHLSQVGCANWNHVSLPPGSNVFTVPFFQRSNDGRLVFIGSKYLPKFDVLTEGFTTLKMIRRPNSDSSPAPNFNRMSENMYPWDKAQPDVTSNFNEDIEYISQEELLSLRNENGTRTTVIIKMKGDVDIMVTPLVLESLQRFVDAVTPTLSVLHPVTVLNHLHMSCISIVESANVLKKDKYLSQLQGGGSKRSTVERVKSIPKDSSGTHEPYNIFEEFIASQIQGTIILPKINVSVLQASIVEEVISFSALDNLRDLTCVSLFAICIDEVTARFHYGKQAREVVQTFHRPTITPSGQKKGVLSRAAGKALLLGLHFTTAPGKDNVRGEPVYIETLEKQEQETVITFNISKIHIQLRRLRNECSVLKDAVITAIPSYSSKVLFTTCSKASASPSNTITDSLTIDSNNTFIGLSDDLTTLSEDKMGFIMMECGFEGVSFKLVKRSKFEKDEEQNNEVKEGNTDGNKSSSPDGHFTDSVRSKDELEANIKHTNETNNEISSGVNNANEQESNSQKEKDKAGVGSVNGNSGNSTLNKNIDGNASSCIIEIQQVWFNFAAPPRTPITRKIDYTRLDWNLLSTASPAINAWMNPSNRFAIRVVHMLRCRYRRNTAVITCLMAEALDVQSLHIPVKSRYGRITPMVKTLQEDPSCQLCNILRKYVLLNPNIEEYLKNDVPHLSILRQGVIVLSRQWKNILYTPLLLEHNFKSKRHVMKPLSVTFAIPDPEEENAVLTDEGDGDGEGDGEADVSCEECEVTDECAMLLNPTSGVTPNTLRKVLKTPSHKYVPGSASTTKVEVKSTSNIATTSSRLQTGPVLPANTSNIAATEHSSASSPNSSSQQINVIKPSVPPRRKKNLLPTQQLSSSRASVIFPIAGGLITYSPQHQYLTRTDTSLTGKNNTITKADSNTAINPNYMLHSCDSVASLCSGAVDDHVQNSAGSLDGPNVTPQMISLFVSNSGSGGVAGLNKSSQGEDLYTWMAKQGFEDSDTKVTESKVAKSTFWDLPKEETRAVSSGMSSLNPDYTLLAAAGFSLYPMHDSLRLLDAHLIFEPFLSSLGVMPQQMITNSGSGNNNGVTSLDSWGSNLTLVGGMESMRIDIVVSELGKGSFDFDSNNKKVKAKQQNTSKGVKLTEKHSLEMPSEIPAFLCERVNLECDVKRVADMTVVEDLSRQRRNMLYVSRGQLKKHSNTVLNVGISTHYISQQVNMPLLRLLHQISNMYQNVKDTQSELKEREPTDMKIPPPKPQLPAEFQTTHSSISSQADGKPPKYPYFIADTKTISTPPSSVRSTRHQSLAQRLRSTSRSVKGYINLGDGTSIIRNRFPSLSDDKVIQIKEESTPAINSTPKCWKTVYYLLDLYATKPETKTVTHRISGVGDVSEGYKGTKKYDTLIESKSSDDAEKIDVASSTLVAQRRNVMREEKTRLIIFAVARINRTKLLATLSGLKLEAEITNLHSSLTCRKKIRPLSLEYSVTGQVGRTMIVLLEGVAPNQQTVVKVTVGKSQALYSSMSRRSKDKNSALLTVGPINIEIPQHPVALHGMMTRGTKQLSSTLQELRVTRTASRMSRGTTVDELDNNVGSQPSPRQPVRVSKGNTSIKSQVIQSNHRPLLQPLVMHFTVVVQSLSITASLLPSLQAQYQMDQLTSNGFTGSKAKFVIDLPRHSLSFSTKVEIIEANLPSEACIELPKVHVSAEYVQDSSKPKDNQYLSTDGAVLRAGNYLGAVADIGVFEQSLTTDLLNHLMFVQKVFMKEINEVVQKVYGGEKPVPIWLEDTEETNNTPVKRILFSLIVTIKRIQLTATTPTNCAVRLETGSVEFQISNRVQNISGASVQSSKVAKIFVKTQVDVNLSLGQLIKNVLFEEADPEFQQFAFFKTRIGIRNAFQGEMVGEGEDKEVILITLRRPLIYIQPVAVDKAILVWLNYKNAYEYWNEQRSILNSEVLSATQQIYERISIEKLTSSSSSGILFLQLTVEDMGICIPLNPLPPNTWGLNRSFLPENEFCAAVVITLESTSISACSAGSLVSKGRFIGLCLRFADDFETSLDDWKPDINNELAGVLMNFCSVSEGTYEVCSRTTTQKLENENPKWFLNVQWQMEGVDIHLDVNIGKQLSALGHTLTMLTGVQEDERLACYDSDEDDDNTNNSQESLDSSKIVSMDDTLSPLVCDGSMDSKKRSKLLEKEMYEQVKIINDLRSLGASQGTIEQEVKRLHELETLVFRGFRRDMIQKLRRQSVKGKYQLKDKFGLGTRGTYRSKSFILSSPTKEQAPLIIGQEHSSSKPSPLIEETKLSTLPRVTFSESRNVHRQISLPSTSSNLSLSLEEKEPMNWLSEHESKSEDVLNTDDDQNSTAESSTLLEELSVRDQLKNGNAGNPKQQEPNIDFELDVKVFINSGKCVLHTKDEAREDELKMISKMKKDRSSSGGNLEFPASPCVNRRSHKEKQPSYSRLRLNPNTVTPAQIAELTIFHIPGLDVKVHYESKIIPDGNLSPCYTVDSSGMIIRKTNAKKASLFAWITLQSIPEETIISPHILEFLEQTLEPIPTNLRNPLHFNNFTERSSNLLSNSEEDDIFARYITSGHYTYASFPVDVIVYFHMQPSTFRFSCLPVSRVECMLKLPSLDIVFSSKRADSFNGDEYKSESCNNLPIAVGGLSITGVMADFSLYIFHPYGGKKPGSTLKDAQTIWSPLADAERKDSLSVNVEFVKFHLSRSRKLNFETPVGKNTEQSHATIRFSTIVDIGSASFKYDMRRLTEILAFPKAWYRRSIIRRLFLGDLTRAPIFSDGDEESGPDYSEEHDHESGIEDERGYTRATNDKNSKNSVGREKVKRQESKKTHHKSRKKCGSVSDDCVKQRKITSSTAWQTLVLFAVNFKRLNVHMNMGNVMGNVTWLTKDFHSEGRLSIGSTGHKNMFIGLGFGGSSLDAKGGIVGGTIELSKIDTFISIHEDPGTEPDHTVGLKLFALELRLDYMGTAILMSRVSSLNISLRDEWKVIMRKSSGDVLQSTKRPGMVFMHGDLNWDQLQFMISKSTAADLIKMYYKLDEFFSQQFKSSKRLFSSLQEGSKCKNNVNANAGGCSIRKRNHQPQKKKIATMLSEGSTLKPVGTTIARGSAQHHRHWQPGLSQVANLHLCTMKHALPSWGTVLGGTMDLHGTNISLACFHGINFKSKSWALFSLKEPCISFGTEAQEVETKEAELRQKDVHIVETLTFSLGMMPSTQTYSQHHSMATICRVSRNVLFPPQFRTIQEWFHYAFSCSDIDAVDRFPSLERERLENTSDGVRCRTPKPQETINHTREVIFALPSLQLHFKTEHLQSASPPHLSNEKPLVDCSFITEFEDHIFVTVDAEAFFFLHDLITSYMREKERVSATQGYHRAYSPTSPESSKRRNNGSSSTFEDKTGPSLGEMEERYSKDWRNFQCKTWHLEPTVRLLSWGGKSIEPYGVDYILQKLGFSHARTTIPKYMQRGFMDPLDKVLAVLVLRIIALAKEDPKNESRKSEH